MALQALGHHFKPDKLKPNESKFKPLVEKPLGKLPLEKMFTVFFCEKKKNQIIDLDFVHIIQIRNSPNTQSYR